MKKMSKEMLRHKIMEEADDMFGDSPTYWYALLSTAIYNQEVSEEIIERLMCSVRRTISK